MTITRRLKQAVYLACLRKPQSARQILEKVNKVIKDASYEDVVEVLQLQEVNGKVNAVDIVYALPPKKSKNKKKNTLAVRPAAKLAKSRRGVVRKHVAKKGATKATGQRSE